MGHLDFIRSRLCIRLREYTVRNALYTTFTPMAVNFPSRVFIHKKKSGDSGERCDRNHKIRQHFLKNGHRNTHVTTYGL